METVQSGLAYYKSPVPESARRVNYRVEPVHAFTDAERVCLEEVLRVESHPYNSYGAFLEEIDFLLKHKAPAFVLELMARVRSIDLTAQPVLYFKNCPVGVVPELDFDDPRGSKIATKKCFVAEAFHAVFAKLHGTEIVTHMTSSYGDMFHDITGKRSLQYSHTHKTLNTIGFHRDLPWNKVVPDWVYLLSLRNSPKNVVYTPMVRLSDVFAQLDAQTLDVLRQPLFRAPVPKARGDMRDYGLNEMGYSTPAPLLDAENPGLAFVEGLTESPTAEGQEALEKLRVILHSSQCNLFLEERDFVAMSAAHSIHGRHVVDIKDEHEHQRRWLLKTWIVNDAAKHSKHFMPDRINTSDE